MAEKSTLLSSQEQNAKQEEFRDSCSLCFESYKGRVPKLLPCFHTFCLPCLSVLVQSAASAKTNTEAVEPNKNEENVGAKDNEERGEEGERETAPVVIACPTCRALIPVPKGRAEGLQTNFYLVEKGAREDPPSFPALLCEMCEEGEGKEASHVCQKCCQRMCPACKRLHDKFTDPREHPVRPVTSTDARPPNEKRPPSNPKCATHVDQDLCFFCKTCDVPVCLHCKLTSHQPHVTEDMTSAALGGKERVKEFVTSAREQIEVLEKAVSRLSRREKELARERQEVTEEVSARCDEILRWVKRSRGGLMDDMETKAETAGANLKGEANRAKDTLEALSRLALRDTPDTGVEVWIAEKELKAALLKEDALDHFRAIADDHDEDPKTCLRVTSDPSVLDLGTVRAYVGKLEASGKTLPSSPLTQQVQEVRGQVADLESRLKISEQTLERALQALQEKQQTTEKMAEETKAKVESAEARLDTVQKRVAFTVWHKTNPLSTPGNGVLIMDHVAVNIGNGYDVTTGIFTAPIAGLYNLQGTIMAYDKNQGRSVFASLFVNNGLYGMMVADSSHGYWDQSTVRAVVNLQAGQTACLKNTRSSNAAFYSDVGQPYTSFSGFLVQAD